MMKLIRSIFGDIRTYNSQLNFRWTSNPDLASFFRAEYKGNASEAYDYFMCTGKGNFSG
jgi:hypothetical protein